MYTKSRLLFDQENVNSDEVLENCEDKCEWKRKKALDGRKKEWL